MNVKMVKKNFLKTREKLTQKEHPVEKVGAGLRALDALDSQEEINR